MAECPGCGRPYAVHTVVAVGDTFYDHMSSPPFTTFKRYARVCVHPHDMSTVDAATRQTLGLYFHTFEEVYDDDPP